MKKRMCIAVCFVAFGAILGYFGAIILYLGWIATFVMGVAFGLAMQRAHSHGKLVLYDAWYLAIWIATGIFLGGLPTWFLFTGIILEQGASRLLGFQIFGSAGCFFIGALVYEFNQRRRENASSKIG